MSGLLWPIQEALRQADTYGDGSLYAQSPGQTPGHVHNRVARVVDELMYPIVSDLTRRATRAEYERDDAQRTHDRREDRIEIMRQEVTRLRGALARARGEIDRWGYGDFHYGATPREPSVLVALADIDAVLGIRAEPPRAPDLDPVGAHEDTV